MCPKCNTHGDWNILERLIKKSKLEGTIKDYIEELHRNAENFNKDWENIINETTSIADLSEEDILELFRLFEYPVSMVTYNTFGILHVAG